MGVSRYICAGLLLCLSASAQTTASATARSYALNVDTLAAQGRIDEARQAAHSAADRISDQALYARAAAFEDRYGADSSRYYKLLVEAMRAAGQPESAWRAAAERGMFASIRERQTAGCKWFAALIASDMCGPDVPGADPPTVIVQGGLRALMYMAGGPQIPNTPGSGKASLADFSRTLTANQSGRDPWSTQAYRENLIGYFRLLAELKAMGKPVGGETQLRLFLGDSASRSSTEHALNLLGWHAPRVAGKYVVELATESPWARHRDLASALAVDVVAMQERLQSGKEFLIEIPDDAVGIFPAEAVWQSQLYAGSRYAGGFAEAMVRDPAMAALYTVLSGMEPSAASLLIQSVNMRILADRYVKLLTLYSSSLDFSGGHIELPGGDSAAPIWAALAGLGDTRQIDPQRFLLALLDRDEGRFLHFYFVLSQLDSARQAFFTANLKRTKAFYEAFRQSSQVEGRVARDFTSSRIEDLFRELPLDENGHVLFPGGPAVWLRAKNQASTLPAASNSPAGKEIPRVSTAEAEDEILLRLIRGEYTHKGTLLAEWQNFLAVVRVDAARPQPLDDASALLLAENYSANRSLYGYFAGLTALQAAHYREVLRLDAKIEALDRSKGNVAAGLFESVLYLLSAAEKTGRITPPKAAALLMDFAGAMNQAPSSAQWSRASLEFLGSYLDAAGEPRNSTSLCKVLVPAAGTQPVNLRNSCMRVLELQNVPPIDDLLKIHGALKSLASLKGDPRPELKVLSDVTRNFKYVEAPEELQLPPADREMLESGEPSRYASLNEQLQKAAGNSADPKRLGKLTDEYWDALAPRTMVALAGQVYAVNFRPDDLLVADDPLFIRKHRFVPMQLSATEVFTSGELDISNSAGGSRVTGGFDRISTVAGQAAAGSQRNLDGAAGWVASALLGSIRTTDWSRYDQAYLRHVVVQVHAARDWLILAATHAPVYDAVRTSTCGLISYDRRARLLTALQHRDWDNVWRSLSLADLLSLAERLRGLTKESGGSPSIAEYMATIHGQPGARPNSNVPTPYEMAATSHPAVFAERVAEFRLYLACLFAEQAIPAASLPSVAEASARAVLSDIRMTNSKDWQAVLDAYERFDATRLREIIGTL